MSQAFWCSYDFVVQFIEVCKSHKCGDTAVVRTHHHRGQTAIENGKKVLDYNREVFVLRKINGGWKIVLYTFSTDPVQGEG